MKAKYGKNYGPKSMQVTPIASFLQNLACMKSARNSTLRKHRVLHLVLSFET